MLKIKFTKEELKNKIKQNTDDTLKEFAKRMNVVLNMNTIEFRQDNPTAHCPFADQQDLAANANKEQLLSVLSEFLCTQTGKRAASQIVGFKTFKDMYKKATKNHDKSKPKQQSQDSN